MIHLFPISFLLAGIGVFLWGVAHLWRAIFRG